VRIFTEIVPTAESPGSRTVCRLRGSFEDLAAGV
jgi:hypothetical protein